MYGNVYRCLGSANGSRIRQGTSGDLESDGDVVITMQPGAGLQGIITASDTREPLEGARVELSGGRSRSLEPPEPIAKLLVPDSRSDPHGRWSIEGLAPGLYKITTSAPGRRTVVHENVSIDRGKTLRFYDVLAPVRRIEGSVRDAERKPVKDAEVRVSRPPFWRKRARVIYGTTYTDPYGTMYTDLPRVFTKDDGSFVIEIEDVPPDLAFRITVEHPEYCQEALDVKSTWKGKPIHVDIRLSAGTSFSGVVQDESGNGIPGALVFLDEYDDDERPDGSPGISIEQAIERRHQAVSAGEKLTGETTDNEGKFRLRHVKPGDYRVFVDAGGRPLQGADRVHIRKDEPLAGQVVRVDLGAALSGAVSDELGAGIPGAELMADQENDDRFTAYSDSAGEFAFRGLQGDRCTLWIAARGFSPKRFYAVPCAVRDLRIVLERTGGIAGTVSVNDGEAPPAVFVTLSSPVLENPSPPGSVVTTELGRFVLEDAPTGTWGVHVAAAGFRMSTVENVIVEPGRTTRGVDVTLERGGMVIGHVIRRSDGSPIEGAEVKLWSGLGESFPRDIVTGADGSFTIDGVAAGKTSIHVSHRDFGEQFVEGIMVEERGEPSNFEISLLADGAIEGRIEAPPGAAQGGFRLLLLRHFDGYDVVRTKRLDAGDFAIRGISPGSYGVSVRNVQTRDNRSLEWTAQVIVSEGETTNVEVSFGLTRLTGRLLKRDRPVISAGVRLKRKGPEPSDWLASRADGDGSFSFPGVWPGRYSVRVLLMGNGGPFVTLPDIDVPDAAEVSRDLILPDIGLVCTVLDAETGEPIELARVQAARAGERDVGPGRGAFGFTDDRGVVEDVIYAPGAYDATASKEGFGSATVRFEAESGRDASVVLELARGRQVRGRVLDEDGVGVFGAEVATLDGGAPAPLSERRTAGDGGFTLDIAPGVETIPLAVFSRGHAPVFLPSVGNLDQEIPIRVTTGGSIEIHVDAPPASLGATRLTVTGEDGRDQRDLFANGPFLIRDGMTDELVAAGFLLFQHLAPGTYAVHAVLGDRTNDATAAVRANERTVIRLVF